MTGLELLRRSSAKTIATVIVDSKIEAMKLALTAAGFNGYEIRATLREEMISELIGNLNREVDETVRLYEESKADIEPQRKENFDEATS